MPVRNIMHGIKQLTENLMTDGYKDNQKQNLSKTNER